MPFVLVLIGLLMIVTGARGTYSQFGSMVAGEFQGKNSFLYFAAAIGGVGAIGYIDALKTFSRLFLILILIGIVVSNKGFFANLQKALAQGPTPPNALPAQTSVNPNSSTSTIQSAISSNQSGAFGQAPTSSGQAKFNGWINWLTGSSTNSAGATPNGP